MKHQIMVLTAFLGLSFLSYAPWALSAPSASQKSLVSVTAGQARDHIVTSREVELSYLLEAALFEGGKKLSQIKAAEVKSPDFAKKVTAVLLEWVVYYEAKSFATVKVSSEELNQAQERAWSQLKSHPRWRELEPASAEVRRMIQRKLQAKEFIRFKAEASAVPITDAEARKYFEQNRLKFGNLPFENFRDTIRAFLAKQQKDQRLKDWFEVLQSKYKVRNFLAEI